MAQRRSVGNHQSIANYCTEPSEELCEFLRRDIFNLAVGNTDNHLRNTSVLKHPSGHIELSPLSYVAPMLLDRAGIPRASRWGEHERQGRIDWGGVVSDLAVLGASMKNLREVLGSMAEFVSSLHDRMEKIGVHQHLRDRLHQGSRTLAQGLSKAGAE